MSCSPFDLKDYFLRELPSPQRVQVEAHVNNCSTCREELERLQLTEAALFSLRDEEIPQRIAFVSDQIFEPSPVRRWFSGFWGSTARLGFASARDAFRIDFLFCCNSTGSRAGTHGGRLPSPPCLLLRLRSRSNSRFDQAVAQAVAVVEARQAETNKRAGRRFRTSQRRDTEEHPLVCRRIRYRAQARSA